MEFNPHAIKAIVGLGNPGRTYASTYHNAGILALRTLLGKEFTSLTKTKTFAYAKTPRGIFAETLVFMNESGQAVQELTKKMHIAPETMLILHDDSDLSLGEYKISFDRGAAGHKGIQSIIQTLGTKEFWRIRIGIRPTESTQKNRIKAEQFVLKNITTTHKKILEDAFSRIAEELGG